jgi:hypothetical protein
VTVADSSEAGPKKRRAFRGLFLVFVLTFVNFVGIAITMASMGGLEPWTRWQFLGLFGVIETAAGLSNIVAPNIWHLPAAELTTSRATRVRLAMSAMLIPHWGGGARAAAGLIMILISGTTEGWGTESVLLIPLIVGLTIGLLGVSAAIGRIGVAHPETDIVQFTIRWRGAERKLEPLSISASIQQFALGIITLPAVAILAPAVLFGAVIRPSAPALILILVFAVLSIAATVLLWAGRLQWNAPQEQQREAEANA